MPSNLQVTMGLHVAILKYGTKGLTATIRLKEGGRVYIKGAGWAVIEKIDYPSSQVIVARLKNGKPYYIVATIFATEINLQKTIKEAL